MTLLNNIATSIFEGLWFGYSLQEMADNGAYIQKIENGGIYFHIKPGAKILEDDNLIRARDWWKKFFNLTFRFKRL